MVIWAGGVDAQPCRDPGACFCGVQGELNTGQTNPLAGLPLKGPLCYLVNLKFAVWVVPSISFTVNCWHVPAYDVAVFQV